MRFLRVCLWSERKWPSKVRTGILSGAITWLVAMVPACEACDFFSVPQRFNTQTSGNVIVLGHQSDAPYKVWVLSSDPSVLTDIRACVLDAFATRSRLGSYIHVGSFRHRGDAEVVGRVLRRSGYPARVVYSR